MNRFNEPGLTPLAIDYHPFLLRSSSYGGQVGVQRMIYNFGAGNINVSPNHTDWGSMIVTQLRFTLVLPGRSKHFSNKHFLGY